MSLVGVAPVTTKPNSVAIFLLAQYMPLCLEEKVYKSRDQEMGRASHPKHSTWGSWQGHRLGLSIPKACMICPLPVEGVSTITTVLNQPEGLGPLWRVAKPTQLKLSCSCAFQRVMQAAESIFH